MKSNNNLCCNVVHQGGGEVVLWEAYFEAQARLALPTPGNLLQAWQADHGGVSNEDELVSKS